MNLFPLLLAFALFQTPVFTDAERAACVAYWNAPGRMRVSLAPTRVNQTPEGSRWLLAVSRAKRGVPGDVQAAWTAWVDAKIARDRWEAAQTLGTATGSEPLVPSVIPAALLGAAGNPPTLAAPVLPKRYVFDLGEGAPILTYDDHVSFGSHYAYYRFESGVESGGTPLSSLPQSDRDALFVSANLTPFERHVMQAVSPLEGGLDSVNTYDTGYVSVGFIQFITNENGNGSLVSVMAAEKRQHPSEFARDFHSRGLDVNTAGTLVVIDPATGAELTGPDAVQKVIHDPRLVAAFGVAGRRSVPFQAAQVQVARQLYYPDADPLTVTLANGTRLTGKVSDVIQSEAGMATLFDRKVNTGLTSPALSDAVLTVLAAHKGKSLADARLYEREIVAAIKYRADYLADKTLTQPPLEPK